MGVPSRTRVGTLLDGSYQGKPSMVGEMPVLHVPVHGLVLAHGRDDDAILQPKPAQVEGLKQPDVGHGQ